MMKRAIRVGLLLGSVACAILAWSAFALRNGPMAVVVDLFMVGTVAAVWVLYRNLIVHHPMDGRIAHAPLS